LKRKSEPQNDEKKAPYGLRKQAGTTTAVADPADSGAEPAADNTPNTPEEADEANGLPKRIGALLGRSQTRSPHLLAGHMVTQPVRNSTKVGGSIRQSPEMFGHKASRGSLISCRRPTSDYAGFLHFEVVTR